MWLEAAELVRCACPPPGRGGGDEELSSTQIGLTWGLILRWRRPMTWAWSDEVWAGFDQTWAGFRQIGADSGDATSGWRTTPNHLRHRIWTRPAPYLAVTGTLEYQ